MDFGRRSGGMSRVRYTEDSAPCERLRTQPVVGAEAWQAEISLLSKRERRNEVRSERDRASSPDAKAKKAGLFERRRREESCARPKAEAHSGRRRGFFMP